jgi:hypothetical protein
MLIHFQKGNSLTTMDGHSDREFLYAKKQDAAYNLNKEKKTYRLLPGRTRGCWANTLLAATSGTSIT